MAALNRIQPPSAIGQPPFHISVCGSSWKARCCSVSAALASVGHASRSHAGDPPPRFSQSNGEGVELRQTETWQICRERYCAGGCWCDFTKHKGFDVTTARIPIWCVVCRSRWLRTSVNCRPRDPDATSVAFQRIPGHDPGGRLCCTSGLPSAGLQHGASVWSVILM